MPPPRPQPACPFHSQTERAKTFSDGSEARRLQGALHKLFMKTASQAMKGCRDTTEAGRKLDRAFIPPVPAPPVKECRSSPCRSTFELGRGEAAIIQQEPKLSARA
ncbi:hypothetical protein cyc_00618 [Cyclospora cayetanensis]|uniref:Uncharacterized protein n=1 Tax=Cyclospora cayetanensis TaxID=88456 RepID=A0A1D3CTJ2_9EIME|nr:hypothetical protein cyc_00618 [Cyclospora cayetanensis]